MPQEDPFGSAVARFAHPPNAAAWPERRAIDALLRECVRLLAAQCHKDPRAWLSEADLQGMLYALLRRELLAHGLPASALHAGYRWRLSLEEAKRLGRQSRTLPLDLILVRPHSIRPLRGRRWTGEIVAALEIKRGFERLREIRADLARLAALRAARPEVLTYLVVQGYRSDQREISAARREAQAADIPLLYDNYWGSEPTGTQPEMELLVGQ